jgi:hypothetical protein
LLNKFIGLNFGEKPYLGFVAQTKLFLFEHLSKKLG